MARIEIAFYQEFMFALERLPQEIQKKTNKFLKLFAKDPEAPGINYERIQGKKEKKSLRSVRIDQNYRAILLFPKDGNQYVMLWVDKHDDAYAWADRMAVSINSKTNVLQVFRQIEAVEIQVSPDSSNAQSASDNSASISERIDIATVDKSTPLFNLDDTRLLSIGVPDTHVPLVMGLVSREKLEEIKLVLPIEAYEALALFADGTDWQEIVETYGPTGTEVDTDDIAGALNLPANQRLFRVVESELELSQMLDAPLEQWRVFLHPSQRKLINTDRNGPVRVTGGAGTGKTVVAMHRAVQLAKTYSEADRPAVLFLTFNSNLARDISASLSDLADTETLKRIEVINIDAWMWRTLKRLGFRQNLCDDKRISTFLDDALAKTKVGEIATSDGGVVLTRSFYMEEWNRTILPQNITEKSQYLQASRTGRGVPLAGRQRDMIWPVFSEMRKLLNDDGLVVRHDAFLAAENLMKKGGFEGGYQHVIVDETQDMGSDALKLIRAIVPEQKNDLFFVGDGNQRIFSRPTVMKHCGINIVGRSYKLRINYRTTEEIRQFASAIMQGVPIDDLDGGDESGRGYLSLTNGPKPIVESASNKEAEIELVAERLHALQNENVLLSSCCLMLRTTRLRDAFSEGLKALGIDTLVLDSDADDSTMPGVRVANMHRVKGLEFQHVFMCSMNEGVIPNSYALSRSSDVTEIRQLEREERALAHVCATRAISSLMISWHGSPSEFIAN